MFPGKGLIPFELYPFQQDFINCRDRYRAINKPRQCGISTVAAAEAAWEFDNVPGAQIVIVSKDKDAATNFHKYVYNILHSIRENNDAAPALLKTNERETTNAIGSRIMSLAASKETGRSFSATHLYFDEMAFAEYADDIWQAASPTLSRTGGRATIISTPKGRANMFYRIFEARGNMGFTTFNYGWWDVPDYNPYYEQYINAKNAAERKRWINKARSGSWYDVNRANKTDLQWRQEFEGAFDANQGSVFSTRSLEKTFKKNYLDRLDDDSGYLTDWYTSQKQENHLYACGIDLGRKNDPTVIITYDYTQNPARIVDYKYIEAGRLDWSQIERVIIDHLEHWQATSLHDGTGVGDSFSEKLYGKSEEFYFTKAAKQNIIQRMQHAFDFGMLLCPKIPTLFNEHQRYIWDDKDITQDTVMANALAVSIFHDTDSTVKGFISLDYVNTGAA